MTNTQQSIEDVANDAGYLMSDLLNIIGKLESGEPLNEQTDGNVFTAAVDWIDKYSDIAIIRNGQEKTRATKIAIKEPLY